MNYSTQKFPAYPLITCDPYFSVWSMCDTLNGDFTRHWTGTQHSMTGIITIDGVPKVFMGRMCHNPNQNVFGPEKIAQKSVRVTPLKTIYNFADEKIELEVCFFTPLILNNLKLLSRPVSYVSYSVKSLDGLDHKCSFYFDVSALLAVNEPDETVYFGQSDISAYITNCSNTMLETSGDNLRISWGHLHLAARNGKIGTADDVLKTRFYRGNKTEISSLFRKRVKAGKSENAVYPVLYYLNEFKVGKNIINDFLCIGYDDVHSLEYFGKKIDAYYKKDGESFFDALSDALKNYENIAQKATQFDKNLINDAQKISDSYAEIISIAYRQTIAAHKLAYDGEKALFVSKECFSNGCAATVDVTYPSIPLFLIYEPKLVEYMLEPIFDFAASEKWRFDFAPHDVGQYPLLNGQVYGLAAGELMYDYQMPIEECGNMILCVAAICKKTKSADYAMKHFDILQKWADYLVKFGFDPENQLCTDDFAGHLAHNCNLSIKAILGIAAWGMLLDMMDNTLDGERYISLAKNLASQWKEKAYDGDHYKLSFDKSNSWSIKYNLVWDKLFDLNIFDSDIFDDEIKYYKTKINKYGVPLDSRSDYTKSDWQMWSTILSDDKEYTDKIISSMLNMLKDTNDHVPFTDWYYSSTAVMRGFQNRTVQGGLFIKLLKF
ncbi:MAG: DUF4965 domain-containing protein [Oscillospiraceae bacterium]|nr:DUF4965 domain-containing protein [Oscillospiraceae bacterium]